MSFLNQMVMADQLYQQQQKEREDREFELLKRKQEQAELAQKAYLMPFETKELQAQYEDKANERANAEEQKAFNKWMTPYEPQIGMNDDGTRQLDVRVPVAPAVAGLMAAGLGTMGNNVEDFIRPFNDQAINVSREYNTPDEIKTKADAETEHKRALELAGARKAAPRASSTSPKAPKAPAQSAQEKQYIELVKKAYVQNEQEFQAKHKRRPNEAEIKELSERAVSAARVQIEAMQLPAAATTPTQKPAPAPAASKKAGTSPTPDDDPFAKHEQFKNDAVTTPPPPPTQTVNLKDKQAANVATPVAAPYVQPLPISIPQNTPQHVADLLKIVEGNWPSIAADNGFSNEDRDLFAQILIETANNPQLQRIQQGQAWDPTGQAKSLHDSIFQSALMEFRKRRFAASQQPFDVQAAQAKFQDAVKNRLPSYRR